jgi:hypothetical protein
VTIIHLATNGRYGFHREALRPLARHLVAWRSVQQFDF